MGKIFLFISAVLSCLSITAQFNHDFGISLGMATHMGDVGGPLEAKRLQASRVNYAVGGFYRYKMSSNIYVKGTVHYAQISGDDKFSDVPSHIARNLNFRTNILEVAGIGEYHFIDVKDFGRTGRYATFFNVYVFAGVGVAQFEPQAQRDNGEWVKLRPLKTEGVNYSNITPIIPFGIGSHMTFDRKWRIGVEIGARPTFTDYLDDVHDKYLPEDEYTSELQQELGNRSNQDYIDDHTPDLWPVGYKMRDTRGGAKSDDWYFFAEANVSWLMRGKSNFYRARYHFAKGHRYKKRRSRAKF